MMKKPLLFSLIILLFSIHSFSQVDAGRMNEIFVKTDLVTGLSDPWEITYGPDDSLWVTEAKGFRVRKIHPGNGGMRTVLDLTNASSFTPAGYRKTYTPGGSVPDPQGGMMGLAIHPEFMTDPLKKFVYVAYIHDYVGTDVTLGSGEFVAGPLFTTWVVRFTYTAGMLRSPVTIVDTIRGSNDHNSGRMIIAPVNGVNYLFYAVGDMGGGQFGNITKVNKAQNVLSYEGKILRFSLEQDATDPGSAFDKWIPADNPFNGATQSAVWSTGMRNNQGFAYANINGVDRLYGSSHGPFSDDELNLIEKGKNYGHPIVVGFNDGNYNGARAGQIRYPWSGGPTSNLPVITSEAANVAAINAAIPDSYRDPLYSFYDTIAGTTGIVNSIQYIYNNTSNAYNANGSWASEGFSGLGIYTNSKIPGWRNSLLYASLKKGRVLRTRLNPQGTAMIPIGTTDTASYFNSTNKFRDVAVSANGKDIYTVIDQSPTTSGPGATNPIVSACGGCVQRYTFVGYANNAGASTIPNTIPIARGVPNTCTVANSVTIDASNTNLWVPITDDSSNVIAEIKANGNLLGVVTTSFFYKNSGPVREEGSAGRKMYMDRNIQITPTVQPSSAVDIRLYVTTGELTRIANVNNSLGQPSGISTINDVSIFKNNNPCSSVLTSNAAKLTTTRAAFGTGNGYVLTASITSFSSFYFGPSSLTTLPVNLLTFNGDLKPNKTVELTWKTTTEVNMSKYEVERSIDGQNYVTIGTVAALGGSATNSYSIVDNDAANQPTLMLYYRLKMVDIDDSYKASNIVTISLSDVPGKVLVSPNPAAGFTKLSITSAGSGNANWRIVDNAGRVVLQNSIKLKAGANTSTINISQLAAGMYYLEVSGNGISQKIKLQKL